MRGTITGHVTHANGCMYVCMYVCIYVCMYVFAQITNRLGPMTGEVMKVYHTPHYKNNDLFQVQKTIEVKVKIPIV